MRYSDFHFYPNEERDNALLLVNLLLYAEKLEKMIIELRETVDELTPTGQDQPYGFELHSDIYENFEDCRAYEKQRKLIEHYLAFAK